MPNANTLKSAIAELDYILGSPGNFTRPGKKRQIENARNVIVWLRDNRKLLNALSAPDEVETK